MKLETINKYLNLLLICLVIQHGENEPTILYFSTIFRRGWVKRWPHIRLLDWMGY